MQGVPEEEPEIGVNTTMTPKHKSPMGIGGTLRDILGGLGDAFNASAGLPPRYAMKREREKTGDAIEGMADTEGMDEEALNKRRVAIFERLRKINPELAVDVYTRIQKSGAEDSFNNARIDYYKDKGRSVLGQMAGTATEENWPKLSKMMKSYAGSRGLSDIEVPDQFDKAWADIMRKSVMSPYQRERLEDFDEDLDRKREQGERRLAQGDERVRQGRDRVRQGDTRLRQGDERVAIARERAKGKTGTAAPAKERPLPPGWSRKAGKVYNAQGIEMRPPQ